MKAVLVVLLLVACGDAPRRAEATCEERVCELVPTCSPLTTGTWDWRSETACLESFACGATPAECLLAVEQLPCLSQPPTWDELEAHTRAMVLVREACAP